MPLVYAVSPWVRPFVKYGIKVGVSRARNFVKWRHYAKRLARSYVALGAGSAFAYGTYRNMPRTSRDSHGRAIDQFGRSRSRPYAADGGSMANRKRRRTSSAKYGNPSVMTYDNMSTGRHKSFSRRAMSLLKSTIQPYIDRWNALTTSYDSSGYYPLTYTKTSTVANTEFPVYTFELNSSFRDQGGVGAANPMLRLIRNDATGNYEFVTQVATNEESSATTRVMLPEYYTSTVSPVSAPDTTNFYHLDWTSIKMLITGPRKTATRVKLQLCRWIDDAATMPSFFANGTLSATNGYPTGEDLDRFNGHWQQFVAPLIGNPIASRTIKNSKPIWTVLQSKTFDFQPRDTSDDGPTGGVGDTKVLRWLNRVGHTYDFNRAALPANPDPDEERDPNEWGVSFGNNQIVAKDKARLFLVISAYTPVPADGTNLAPDVGASFDLQIRRKWYLNA